MSKAIDDVLAERERQKAAEGWTPEHNDKHGRGELAKAAACYAYFGALPEPVRECDRFPFPSMPPQPRRSDVVVVQRAWPTEWGWSWWKPKDRRRDLVRAGALIIAEIERLDRAEAAKGDA
jgi:hypothetical protein